MKYFLHVFFKKNIYLILIVLIFCTLTSSNTLGSNVAYSNNIINYQENETINQKNRLINYTANVGVLNSADSQLYNNITNLSNPIFEGKTGSSSDYTNNKIDTLNQIIEIYVLLITVIIAVIIALYQLFNPKYHQLLETLLKKESYLFISIILIVFGIFAYNFYIIPTNRILDIEFFILAALTVFLIYFVYKLTKYSNKYNLISSYLSIIVDYDIFKEICNRYGYPEEENIQKNLFMELMKSSAEKLQNKFKNSMEEFSLENKDESLDSIKKKFQSKNQNIRFLNKTISKNSKESDIESIYDILLLAIEDSDYRFFSKIIEQVDEILFSIIKNDTADPQIKEKIIDFLFMNYNRLVTKAININKFEFYLTVSESYEKMGKILIDKGDLEKVKILVDKIGRHAYAINKKTFHEDYSYKATDCIFNLIYYYIDKKPYSDYEVQKWLETIGSIAEDITEVDYKIKYKSIRVDYTTETESKDHPVYQIINNLEKLNKQVIRKIPEIENSDNKVGCIVEVTSLILKNITMKLIKVNDFSTTYSIYSAYKTITEDAMTKKIHYALGYILQDLHQIGNEIIEQGWFNNANAFLFDIAKLGILAENKKVEKPEPWLSGEFWFYDFAKILKDLYKKFVQKFNMEPYERYQGDFFHELIITSDATNFIQYYEFCEPDIIIYGNFKEEP